MLGVSLLASRLQQPSSAVFETARGAVNEISSVATHVMGELVSATGGLPSWAQATPGAAFSQGVWAGAPKNVSEVPASFEPALHRIDPSHFLGFSDLFSVGGDLCGALAVMGIVGAGVMIGLPVIGAILNVVERHSILKKYCAEARQRFADPALAANPLARALRERYDVPEKSKPNDYQFPYEVMIADAVAEIIATQQKISAMSPDALVDVQSALESLNHRAEELVACGGRLASKDWLKAEPTQIEMEPPPSAVDAEKFKAWTQKREERYRDAYDGGIVRDILALRDGYKQFAETVAAYDQLRRKP